MRLLLAALASVVLTACAGNTEVVGERVTVEPSGVVDVCGEGDGQIGRASCRERV